MTTRFYKHWAESEHGEGVVYFEITDGWPTRQVEVYGTIQFVGDDGHPRYLADQPFEVLELTSEHEVNADEFADVWKDAVEHAVNLGRGDV